MSIVDRIQRGWNAFMNKDPTSPTRGPVSSSRPDRRRLYGGNDKSIVTAVYNRIAMDAAQCDIEHVLTDDNKRYSETINSDLNLCLTLSANLDQTGRAFKQDLVMSMLDEGCVAAFPFLTEKDKQSGETLIDGIRVCKIVQWAPKQVKIRGYDEDSGIEKEIWVDKKKTAIIENPFFAIMNHPNSTASRLMRKLALLDIVDEYVGSGKLDLIIQLPYLVKSPARKAQAEERRKDIEMQLASSKYGVAYTDGTEHITQLNRSVDNQLLSQIDKLIELLYSQFGITQAIMNQTADENEMNNYYARTIEPILSAITDEMTRKFLSTEAWLRGERIMFFRDPFKLIPTSQFVEMADPLTRNEILTSNEIRQIAGMKPSKDPRADELHNSNISDAADEEHIDVNGNPINTGMPTEEGQPQN